MTMDEAKRALDARLTFEGFDQDERDVIGSAITPYADAVRADERAHIEARYGDLLSKARYGLQTTLLARLVADLDRCEHGRHAPDVCDQCGGRSHGNPLADIKIGNDLEGSAHTVADLFAALTEFRAAVAAIDKAAETETTNG